MSAIIAKTCKNCGRSFLTRDKNKDYCNLKCKEYAKEGIKVDIDDYEPPRKDLSKKCKWCGETFHISEGEGRVSFSRRLFCSKTCAMKYRNSKYKRKGVNYYWNDKKGQNE